MTENYRGCYEYLSAQYPEVGGYEFYKELFPDNENSGERHTDFSHPNAVYLYRDEPVSYTHLTLPTSDLV